MTSVYISNHQINKTKLLPLGVVQTNDQIALQVENKKKRNISWTFWYPNPLWEFFVDKKKMTVIKTLMSLLCMNKPNYVGLFLWEGSKAWNWSSSKLPIREEWDTQNKHTGIPTVLYCIALLWEGHYSNHVDYFHVHKAVRCVPKPKAGWIPGTYKYLGPYANPEAYMEEVYGQRRHVPWRRLWYCQRHYRQTQSR